MKPKPIRLFVKPYCPWCQKAEDWLKQQRVDYQRLDVIDDPKALTEMERLSGQTCAPVLDAGGQVLADFGPEELAAFWPTVKARLVSG